MMPLLYYGRGHVQPGDKSYAIQIKASAEARQPECVGLYLN